MKMEDAIVLGLIALGLLSKRQVSQPTPTPMPTLQPTPQPKPTPQPTSTPTPTPTPTTTTSILPCCEITPTQTPTTTAQTEAQLLKQIQTTYPNNIVIKTVDNNGNAVYSVVDQTNQTAFPVAVVKQTMPGYPTRIVIADQTTQTSTTPTPPTPPIPTPTTTPQAILQPFPIKNRIVPLPMPGYPTRIVEAI